MKTFQDLEIIAKDAGDQVAKHLIAACWPPWMFDESRSDRLTRSIGGETYAFKSAGDSTSKPAWLCLVRKSEDRFRVSNIGPAISGQFSYDEYNAVLKSFVQNVVARIPKEANMLPVLGSAELDLAVILGEEAMAMLRSFSSGANRNALHPNDRARLYDFIGHLHRNSIELDGTTFERWLIEDDKWAKSQASEMHDIFASARDLLRHYDPRS